MTALTVETYIVLNTGETGWCIKDGDDTVADFYGPDAETNARRFAATPRVFVKVSGGLVQGTVSDVPCDIEILDYDCDSTEEEALYEIPEKDGEVDVAWIYSEQPLVDTAYCDIIQAAIEEGSVGDRRGTGEAEQDAGEVVRDLSDDL